MKAIIGVTVYKNTEARTLAVRENYLTMLRECGAMPLMLPITTDPEEIKAQLALCDGLLITGGGDVAPALYGEEALPECGTPDDRRDAWELKALEGAIARDMPVFCICRGIQVLNVFLGGSLYQDISSQISPEAHYHLQAPPYGEPCHSIRLVKGSPLEELWHVDNIDVNSSHHQAIKRLVDSLKPMAYAPEGFIEAVYMPGKRFVRAVQWHPEHMCESSVRDSVRIPQMQMIAQFTEAANKALEDKARNR